MIDVQFAFDQICAIIQSHMSADLQSIRVNHSAFSFDLLLNSRKFIAMNFAVRISSNRHRLGIFMPL